MIPSATIRTTSPVISGGKRKRSRWTTRAKANSKSPATIVIPRISGMPPSQAASAERAKKFGPQTFGQR